MLSKSRLYQLSPPTIDGAAQKMLDARFIADTGLPGLVLMEQAAWGVSQLILGLSTRPVAVLFLAGAGNNGGDAWASARQLLAQGYPVRVAEMMPEKTLTPDTSANRQAYLALGGRLVTPEQLEPGDYQIVVDGILGTGFRPGRPLPQAISRLIEAINQTEDIIRIAIDIPSGLASDSGACGEVVFAADYTVTFSALKTGLVTEPGCISAGTIIVCPISMPSGWLEQVVAEDQSHQGHFLPRALTEASFAGLDLTRPPLSHKADYGKSLLIGGSAGMSGAMVLAARAVQAAGVGYSYLRTTREVIGELLSATPESLIDTIPQTPAAWSEILGGMDCVALGPGAGPADWLAGAIDQIMLEANQLIIDADALNWLAREKDWPKWLRARRDAGLAPAILTPHPGEFRRLAPDIDLNDRAAAARQLAGRSGAIIVLKGHASVIALPEGETVINTTGNAGLARAGSGDVLTGLMAGLCARLDDPVTAAALGVFLHGRAADIARTTLGSHNVTPSKLIDYLSDAFDSLAVETERE